MEYTLTFTDQQMHLLNVAIGELPHKHAAPLIQSINEQILAAMPKPETDTSRSEAAAVDPS